MNFPHMDSLPITPGKCKPPQPAYYHCRHRFRFRYLFSKFTPLSILLFLVLLYLLRQNPSIRGPSATAFRPHSPAIPSTVAAGDGDRNFRHSNIWGGLEWERQVFKSVVPYGKGNHTVLVTGAAGFIGFHTAMALKHRGDGVLGLDNFNNYYEKNLKYSRRNELRKAGVFIVEGDINDIDLLKKLFDIVQFTHVLHLAAQAGVRYALENPHTYIHNNVNGFLNLLQSCKNAKTPPAIVWASSSSVYGLNTKVPFSEKDRTDQPASLYAASKKSCEEIAHVYNNIHGLSITGLRFFTVYGPWGRPDMAYFNFTKNIIQSKEITIYQSSGHGIVGRDFTYVDDIVKGCLGALDTAKRSAGVGGKKKGAGELRIYNLGNTKPVSVSKLVSLTEKILKMKAKKKFVPMPRNGDVELTHANITLAQKELGYKPTTDLETGMRNFIKWYLGYYQHDGNNKSVH